MQKQSFLFLLILLGIALLAAYEAFVPSPFGVPQMVIRFLALSAFFLLCVSLMIGPLAVLKPQMFVPLIEPRRAVGIAAFAFGALHILLVMAIYFNWDFSAPMAFLPNQLAAPAAIIMVALTLTACDFAVNRLGMGTWKTIQRLAYIAFVLIFVHLLLASNGLYARDANPITLNLAEVVLVFLGVVTIVLQIAGFLTYRKRQAASKTAVADAATEQEKQ